MLLYGVMNPIQCNASHHTTSNHQSTAVLGIPATPFSQAPLAPHISHHHSFCHAPRSQLTHGIHERTQPRSLMSLSPLFSGLPFALLGLCFMFDFTFALSHCMGFALVLLACYSTNFSCCLVCSLVYLPVYRLLPFNYSVCCILIELLSPIFHNKTSLHIYIHNLQLCFPRNRVIWLNTINYQLLGHRQGSNLQSTT